MDLLPKVQQTVKHYGLLEKGERLQVAVSGGPDSAALLHLLWRLGDFELFVVHLHHDLRGNAADEDAKAVEELAKKLGLPFFVKKVDVTALAAEKNLTIEEAGRLARFHFFAEVAAETGARKVALGHNADDQAETVLMRLIRGAGARGLGGMEPEGMQNGLSLVRPIIDCSRQEIEAYCRWAELTPRIDHTNQQLLFFRNRIRHRYLPLLEEENPQLKKNLVQTAEILRGEDQYLAAIAGEICGAWQEGKIPKGDLLIHPAIARRAIRGAVWEWYREVWDFERIEELIVLAKEPSGQRLSLPGDKEAWCEGNYLKIRSREWEEPSFDYLLPCPGKAFIYEWDLKLALSLTKEYQPGPNRDYFLAGELEFPLRVRTRKAGDRFRPRGVGGTKKLKDWFGDAKIPTSMRERIPLLVDDAGILWVVGRRRSERALPIVGAELVLVEVLE